MSLERAMSRNGFIINQLELSDMKFGSFGSDKNGCGWIAIYNLLRILKQDFFPRDILNLCAPHIPFQGKYGFPLPYMLCKVLNTISFGYEVRLSRKLPQEGILWYTHPQGAHYVAFKRVGQDKYQLFNDNYSNEADIRTSKEIFKGKTLTAIIC